MGFQKRICGNRKMVICHQFDNLILADGALDLDAMDPVAYQDSLFDTALVKVKDGESPAWFEVRPMPHALMLAADADKALGKAEWIIRCCVRGVTGIAIVAEDGTSKDFEAKFKKWNDKLDILDEESAAVLTGFGENMTYALMRQIKAVSEAGRGPLVKLSSTPSGATA